VSEKVGGWPVDLVPGEVKAIRREEHLCETCFHAPVCLVAASIDDEFLIVVSRCAMQLVTSEAVEEDDDDDETED